MYILGASAFYLNASDITAFLSHKHTNFRNNPNNSAFCLKTLGVTEKESWKLNRPPLGYEGDPSVHHDSYIDYISCLAIGSGLVIL